MRMDAKTVCDANECRFHSFADGKIAAGEEIIYKYRAFTISSIWVDFGL